MNCPYCNNEMIKGYLSSGGIIFFRKEKNGLKIDPEEFAIDSGFKAFFTGSNIEAEFCDKCKKIIIANVFQNYSL